MKGTAFILSFGFLFWVPVLRAQSPLTASDYNKRGNALAEKGDLDGAIANFDKAVALDPLAADVYYNRGTARKLKGDLDGAIADYDKAIELDPRDASNYNNRGVAWEAKRDLDRALADYSKAVRLDPRHASSYNNLAWILATCREERLRNAAKTVEYAQRACELTDWQQPDYMDTLAAAYAEAGDFGQAVKWESRALEFPEYPKEKQERARRRL